MKLILKENGRNLVLTAIKLAIAVLLLIDPVNLTAWVIRVFGLGATVQGVLEIVRYIKKPAREAAKEYHLTKGLLMFLGGLFCIIFPNWFTDAFPFMARIYSIGALVACVVQLQWMIDMLRIKMPDWQLQGLNALLSAILAAVIWWNPFFGLEALWLFIAIALIVMSVPEILMIVRRIRGRRPPREDKKPGDVPPPPSPAENSIPHGTGL